MKSHTFAEWIDGYGHARLARDLRVNERTVRNWVHGRSCPSVRYLQAVKKLSGGKIDYDDVIDAVKVKKKRRSS